MRKLLTFLLVLFASVAVAQENQKFEIKKGLDEVLLIRFGTDTTWYKLLPLEYEVEDAKSLPLTSSLGAILPNQPGIKSTYDGRRYYIKKMILKTDPPIRRTDTVWVDNNLPCRQ